jgi:hypothetical protein
METELNDINVYVSFETAKKLKEKGFDRMLYSHYTNGGLLIVSDYKALWLTPAPTLGQAVEWLRQRNVCVSLTVGSADDGDDDRQTWKVRFYDRNLNILASMNGLNITDYNKSIELAVNYAARFILP